MNTNSSRLIAAASLLVASSGVAPGATEYHISNSIIPEIGYSNARLHPRVGGSQRQIRKDRRRAFAAGNRKAFNH